MHFFIKIQENTIFLSSRVGCVVLYIQTYITYIPLRISKLQALSEAKM